MSRELTIPKVISAINSAFQPSGQCDCDCDCACSLFAEVNKDAIGPVSSPMPTSLHRSDSILTLDIDDKLVVCCGPLFTPIILNRPAFNLLTYFDQPHHPRDIPDGLLVAGGEQFIRSTLAEMIALGLLVPEGCVTALPNETATTLSAWLQVTERCNLSCVYCYVPHRNADMSAPIGYAAIECTFHSALAHGYRQVKLKYAGGEPLLCFPLVVKLHRYAHELARQYGLELDGVVLSNGTMLTPEIIETMQSLDLRLMISLDGLGKFHDCQRHFINGRGSFNAVACAVDLSLSNSLVPDISVTVSGRNIDGLPGLMAWVLERNLPFSLNFYRENECSASHTELRLEEEKIIQGMLEAYKVIEANLPCRTLLTSLVDRANLAMPHHRPCSVGRNYMVFDTQGRVSKCQMQMDKAIADVSVVDPLALIRADEDGIQNLPVGEKEGCRECEWRYWCAGGCPLLVYRATGRYDTKSPNCNIYRALYPEVVRLECLRLLTYAERQ